MELAVKIVEPLEALAGLAVAMVALVPKARSWLRSQKKEKGREQ